MSGLRTGAGGFTLIELLVVIAIIALLVTILVPSLSEAKGLAMIATCSSQLHGIGIAIAQYSSHYDMDRPWLFLAGAGTGSKEDDRSDRTQPWCKQPGNPALALCHPDGPSAFEWFLDNAEPLFCFASQYTFESHYAAYPQSTSADDVWGVYRYVHHWIPRSQDPFHRVTHLNNITVAETPQETHDIIMTDWQTDFHHYAHYNFLRLNGVVEFLFRDFGSLTDYMWGT